MTAGVVFDIKEFAVFDGPGIRTTVFMKGCPLRCQWCHNPEGLSPEPQLTVSPSRCLRCGRCEAHCPTPGRCAACGKCIPWCPLGLRRIAGQRTTPEALAR
ncbi:MAG: 4Fe-4S binding protein, partial [Clostridia bacterium]|nr:4Fe-4S binding protein [Clostridia bacterium]